MSSLLPDPADLRAVARRIDAVARTTRSNGERLRTHLAATHWSGPAARAFDVQAHLVLNGLRTAAERLDDAADALRSHASSVEHVLGLVTTTLELGWDLAGDVVGSALDLLGL